MPSLKVTVTVVSDGAGETELRKSIALRGTVDDIRDSRPRVKDAIASLGAGLVDLALEDYRQTGQPAEPSPEAVEEALREAGALPSPPDQPRGPGPRPAVPPRPLPQPHNRKRGRGR